MAGLTFPLAFLGAAGSGGGGGTINVGGIDYLIMPDGSYREILPTAEVNPAVWVARQTSGLTVGDTFRAVDIGVYPGTTFRWDGSAWKALYPLRLDVANRVAGAAQTAEQQPAGWATALPAGLLSAYRALDLDLILTKTGTAGAVNLVIRIGTSATYTSNTALLSQNNLLTAPDAMRFSSRWAWRIESNTSLRGYGAMSAAGLEGSSAASGTSDQSAVTISDITANALNFSIGVTQGSAADITSLSAILTLVP